MILDMSWKVNMLDLVDRCEEVKEEKECVGRSVDMNVCRKECRHER